MQPPTFHGDELETLALLDALNKSCTCAHDWQGAVVDLCGAHRLLQPDTPVTGKPFGGSLPTAASNQRVLDGLLTYRHLRDRLLAEEDMEGHLWEPS